MGNTELPGGFVETQPESEFIQRARSECQHLIALASWLGDQGDAEGYAQCYTPEGVFDRAGEVISGREALARFVTARPQGTVVRHFNCLPLITVNSADSACAVMLSTIVRREGDGAAAVVSAEIHDDYTLTERGWRIARRVARVVPHGELNVCWRGG